MTLPLIHTAPVAIGVFNTSPEVHKQRMDHSLVAGVGREGGGRRGQGLAAVPARQRLLSVRPG